MTGAELDRWVRRIAQQVMVVAWHVPDSRRVTMRGCPDWILLGPRGLLWRETKGDGDFPRPDQKAAGYALLALGQDYAVWTAADLRDGTIRRQIEAIASVKSRGGK